MGLPDVPDRHARELNDANELVRRTVRLLRAARESGAEYILEHPADRGAIDSPMHKRHAPLWLMPTVRALNTDHQATLITFPQCALGADTQ
eukprot:6072083-Pleurochrysis_carterae.AAC.1